MPGRSVTVGTAVVPMAPHRPERKTLAFFNLGGNTIFVLDARTGVTGQGWPILANGSLFMIKADGDDPELAWYGQALVGSNDVRVVEGYGGPVPEAAR